jgi:hypothetical protein
MTAGGENTTEFRQREKQRVRRPPLDAIHLSDCVLLPTREHLLDIMPRNGYVAEIGVAFGDFSAEIIKRAHPQKLYLVDAWEMDRYSAGLAAVRHRFEKELSNDMIHLVQGYSTVAMSTLPDSALDWIYIDTNHSHDTTFAELRLGATKVKRNGLIAGHDFCVGNIIAPVIYGVIEACVRFCQEEEWKFRYMTMEPHGHWSFCLERLI